MRIRFFEEARLPNYVRMLKKISPLINFNDLYAKWLAAFIKVLKGKLILVECSMSGSFKQKRCIQRTYKF